MLRLVNVLWNRSYALFVQNIPDISHLGWRIGWPEPSEKIILVYTQYFQWINCWNQCSFPPDKWAEFLPMTASVRWHIPAADTVWYDVQYRHCVCCWHMEPVVCGVATSLTGHAANGAISNGFTARIIEHKISSCSPESWRSHRSPGPFLLTRINFNPSMDT